MEVPADVKISLENVRETMHLRYNAQARIVRRGSFDAGGRPRRVEHDGRWELWDKDASGQPYRVMVLEDPQGNFLPVGTWLADLVRQIDPARYGGRLDKLTHALIDEPNARHLAKLSEEAIRELAGDLHDRYVTLTTPRSTPGRQIGQNPSREV